ncbi:hypothetical protein Sste5346_000075 [Sporothrix stenoceras]|uniref:ubiquitinyl hydrolase 1 n=1 Tax=Sporothrix stenoceras TaxID=5173 RepID=A0ABR3ZV67_9PEZI
MAENPLATASGDQAAIDAEIAAQEAAARDYRPDVNGPGINELRSTEEIKDQYASADHIFVQKTVNLPRAYPLYRAVRGDGNCGWRAIGFCYFEALIYNDNVQLISDEKKRLLELNDYIRDVGGYDPYVYEDMVEETDLLFDAILKALPDTEQAIRAVTEAFNDDSAGNAIIYHLRLLTASYLKGNVGVYEGFIVHDGGVIGYCQEWIERPNCEIDHLRVEVLASILLKPSDMVLEIAYLDRSNGSTVSVYKFPDTNIGRAEDTITMRMSLLFRPDHYDILYRPSLPSKAVAESTLLRFLPADAAMAALVPTPDPAANVATVGQPASSDPSNPLAAPYLPSDTLAAEIVAQTYPVPVRYYERIVHPPGTPSIREDTPDLTPGSSSHSPATMPVKEEPITPAYASPVPPHSAPQQTTLRRESGATTDTSSLVTPTAPAPAGAAPAPSSTGRTPNDLEIHHVAPISYGSAAQSAGSFVNYQGADFQILSRLPGMFNRFSAQPASSPFGMSQGSSWGGAPGPSQGFTKGVSPFPVSPAMTSAPPTSGLADVQHAVPPVSAIPASPAAPSVIPGTPMSAISSGLSDSYSEPAFSVAGTPVPLMDAPTPVPSTPMAYGGAGGTGGGDIGANSNNNGGGGAGRAGSNGAIFLPEPKSTPVRFTKWHFNRLPHDATDPNSSHFRNSRVSTAHFDNPDFQPQEYDPSGGGSDAPSRNRRKSSVLREDNEK